MRIEAVNFNGVDVDYVYVNGEQVIAPAANSHWVGFDPSIAFAFRDTLGRVYILTFDEWYSQWRGRDCWGAGCADCRITIPDTTGQRFIIVETCGANRFDTWGMCLHSRSHADISLVDAASTIDWFWVLHNFDGVHPRRNLALSDMSGIFHMNPFQSYSLRPNSTARIQEWNHAMRRWDSVGPNRVHHDFTDRI